MTQSLKLRPVLFTTGLLIAMLGARHVQATPVIVAYKSTDAFGNQSRSGNIGLDFDVNSAITVSQLGAYDSGSDGFVGTITVKLWERNNQGTASTDDDTAGNPLATAVFNAANSGTLIGTYQFMTFAGGPLLLEPGSYSVVAQGFIGSDLNGNENISGWAGTTDDGGGLISSVGDGRFDSSGAGPADFPNSTSTENGFPGLDPDPFGAGSFIYHVPEPSPLSLDILPGGGPNSINLNSKRDIPVFILTTDEFDAQDVDIGSLLFGDPLLIDAGFVPVGAVDSKLRDVNHDGLSDLSLSFSVPEMVDNGVLGPLSVEGFLSGSTLDGTDIFGSDSLRIVPPFDRSMGGATNPRLVLNATVTAVREPSALTLFCLGSLCMFCYGWRRRNRAT